MARHKNSERETRARARDVGPDPAEPGPQHDLRNSHPRAPDRLTSQQPDRVGRTGGDLVIDDGRNLPLTSSASGELSPIPPRAEGSGDKLASKAPPPGDGQPQVIHRLSLPGQMLVKENGDAPFGAVANRPYGAEPRGVDPETGKDIVGTPPTFEADAEDLGERGQPEAPDIRELAEQDQQRVDDKMQQRRRDNPRAA
jgi:hypothetical protein